MFFFESGMISQACIDGPECFCCFACVGGWKSRVTCSVVLCGWVEEPCDMFVVILHTAWIIVIMTFLSSWRASSGVYPFYTVCGGIFAFANRDLAVASSPWCPLSQQFSKTNLASRVPRDHISRLPV